MTDYGNVPLPTAPTLPARLGQFTDPAFGTKIIRVTDATDGNHNHVAYSYYSSLNNNNTYLYIRTGSVAASTGEISLYSFNPTTMTPAYVGPLFASNPPGGGAPMWEDAKWSTNPSTPNKLFTHRGARIYSYDVATHAYTLIKDFADTPGWNSGDYVFQFSVSEDENIFAFTRRSSTGAVLGYQVWKRDTNTSPVFETEPGLDEVRIDKTGVYLTVKTGAPNPVGIWNVTNSTYDELTYLGVDDAPGHSDQGAGTLVGMGGNNRINGRDLSTPHTWHNVWTPRPANEGGALWQSGHISLTAADDGWAVVSKGESFEGDITGPFLNEIFMVATDGSGRVIRMAHHRSNFFNPYDYWDWPMANSSRDGRFIVFTSDWANTGQRDVFILRTPIPGDANMDYLVNAADEAIWTANQGATDADWDEGDWDADRDVDDDDHDLWLLNSGGGGGQPTVSIAATDATASETLPNNGVYTITRTGPTTAALVVNFTRSGTATSGTDHNNLGASVTIPIGASSATIILTPVNDALVESSETSILTLAGGTGYTVGTLNSATVTILDNDGTVSPANDDFNYTVGGGANWEGAIGGSGWADAWDVDSTTNTGVYAGSLSHSAGGNALATSGNTVWTWHSAEATRNVSTSYGTNGTSRWIGFLMNAAMDGGTGTPSSEISLGTELRIGGYLSGNYSLRTNIGGSETFANSGVAIQSGTTKFIVARIDYGTTDVVRMWINPTPGTQPSDGSADATLTLPGSQSFATGTLIRARGNAYYTRAQFDELRYGTTYAAVAPTGAGAVPAAPSDLVAIPTTNSMLLSWTDNSSTESGFHIWRSTDNTTWGSVYGAVGAGVTAYTDTAPTAGVAYYYKVTSYNASGDSTTAAGMTSPFATVLASEDFNYTTFNGGNAGYGWSNGWTAPTAITGVYTGSLNFAVGGHGLVTSGDRVWTWHSAEATRNASTSFGTNGTSRWVGFLMNTALDGGTGTITGEINLGTELRIGAPFNGNYSMRSNIGGSETYADSGVDMPSGTTTFIVVRIDYGTTDMARMWIDPTPGIQPSDASADATLTLPAGQTFSVGNLIKARATGYNTRAQFDELRYGLSYIAVAPDPLIEQTPREGHRDRPNHSPKRLPPRAMPPRWHLGFSRREPGTSVFSALTADTDADDDGIGLQK
ncbi:MAG: hypothetical protein WBD40_07695 [Tepidisphaeraceae bacterium]